MQETLTNIFDYTTSGVNMPTFKYQVITTGLRVRLGPPAADGTLAADAGKVMAQGEHYLTDGVSVRGWFSIYYYIKADGKEVHPPAGVFWWCNASVNYSRLVGEVAPVPDPTPPPPTSDQIVADITLRNVRASGDAYKATDIVFVKIS